MKAFIILVPTIIAIDVGAFFAAVDAAVPRPLVVVSIVNLLFSIVFLILAAINIGRSR